MKDEVKYALVEQVQCYINDMQAGFPSVAPPPKKQKVLVGIIIMDSSSSDDDVPLASASMTLNYVREIEMYLKEPKRGREEHPLKWWKDHEAQFVNVSKVAHQILCVLATSTPTERVFPTAGNIVNVWNIFVFSGS